MKEICRPAIIYLIIALVLMAVGLLLARGRTDPKDIFMNLSGILMITIFVAGLCVVFEPLAWILVGFYAVLVFSGLFVS